MFYLESGTTNWDSCRRRAAQYGAQAEDRMVPTAARLLSACCRNNDRVHSQRQTVKSKSDTLGSCGHVHVLATLVRNCPASGGEAGMTQLITLTPP
jgi:hypothetical protein